VHRGGMSTREVIAFARAHGGVITAGEAQELGMPKSTLSRRVVDGVFVRLGRGVLARPGTASRPDALLRAGDRMLGAVVSHITAAGIHRMEPLVKAPPTVTVPTEGPTCFPVFGCTKPPTCCLSMCSKSGGSA
jgi:hypothetical protein